jgi:hypothetical protein
MGMAFTWLLQGGALLSIVLAVAVLRERWSRTRSFVMLFPGGAAIAAYLALESLPISLGIGLMGVGLLLVGLSGIGAFSVIVAFSVAFIATCAIGLCLPNLGIEQLVRSSNT